MKVLLFRLQMCWLCLTARRAVLYAPGHPGPNECQGRVLGSNLFDATDWLTILSHALGKHGAAEAAADERQQQQLLLTAQALTAPPATPTGAT